MRRILIASDLSQRSQRALRRAVSLARQFDSELSALHVVDDDRPHRLVDEERRRAEAALRDDLARAGGHELTPAPRVQVVAGDPFRVIADEADRSDVDVVVMGTHRKRLLGDIFTGTTIERVMRLGGRPVLMVNREESTPYISTLAAVDLSDASAHALRTARDLKLFDPAKDSAVHGFVPLGEGMLHYAGVERRQIDEHVATSASEARRAVTEFLSDNGCGAMLTILVVKGSPFGAIEAGIRQLRPELLVIGTRGHGRLKGILLGSVADQIVRRVECDILVVPPGGNRPAPGA